MTTRVGVTPVAVATTGHRLYELDPRLGFTVGAPPDEGWVRVDRLDEATVTRWIDEKATQVGGHRGIVTGWVAEGLARRVLAPAVGSWVTAGHVPDLRPENLLVRRGAGGVLDRTAFLSALPVEQSWPTPDVIAILAGLFDLVRRSGRFGLRGLWGSAADSAGGVMVRLVRAGAVTPADGLRAWADIDAGFDLAPGAGGTARSRPQVAVTRAGASETSETLVSVRGVCCLYCATPAGLELPEPDRYCGSCPRLSSADRMTRLALLAS